MNERIEQAVDVFLQDRVFSKLLNRNAAIALAKHIYKFSLQNQWISVDEELPHIDEKCKNLSKDVIVKNEYGKVTTAWYSYSGRNWHLCYGEIKGDDLIHSKITHWMPI